MTTTNIGRRGVLSLLAAGVPALVAGCASGAGDPRQRPPGADESVVAISFTGNTGEVTAFDSCWLRREDDGPAFEQSNDWWLRSVTTGGARDTALFIGSLPAGRYRILSLDNVATKRTLNLKYSRHRDELTFDVRAGGAVDLGRLLITPLNTQVAIGRSQVVRSNLPVLSRFAKSVAPLFQRDSRGGWILQTDDRVERYARERPVGADSMIELPGGRVAAASRLGSLLVRDPHGDWRVLHGETLEALRYITRATQADAELLAVGDLQTILRLPPGGSALQLVDPGNMLLGNLLFIGGSNETGWYVLVHHGPAASVQRSDRLESGDWKTVDTIPLRLPSGAVLWIWVGATDGGRGLCYALSTGAMRFLDLASGTWRDANVPGGRRISGATFRDAGIGIEAPTPSEMVDMKGISRAGPALLVTTDGARSWTEIRPDLPATSGPPVFASDRTLLVVGTGKGRQLHARDDLGTTWRNLGTFDENERLVALPHAGLFGVDTARYGLFSIEHRALDGGTWRPEYSNFDPEAYERQKR